MFGVLPPPQASPQLINRGRGHAGAVTSDGFVYAHFCYGVDNGSYWDANDHVLVGRVSKDQPLNRSAWRFWSGVSDTRAHAHAPAPAPATSNATSHGPISHGVGDVPGGTASATPAPPYRLRVTTTKLVAIGIGRIRPHEYYMLAPPPRQPHPLRAEGCTDGDSPWDHRP